MTTAFSNLFAPATVLPAAVDIIDLVRLLDIHNSFECHTCRTPHNAITLIGRFIFSWNYIMAFNLLSLVVRTLKNRWRRKRRRRSHRLNLHVLNSWHEYGGGTTQKIKFCCRMCSIRSIYSWERAHDSNCCCLSISTENIICQGYNFWHDKQWIAYTHVVPVSRFCRYQKQQMSLFRCKHFLN